jgi:formate hydrogenlyase transcriptional activator
VLAALMLITPDRGRRLPEREVAKLVAVAIDNALNFNDAQATQRQLSTARDHLRLLVEVTNALVSNLDLPGLVAAFSSSLERAIPHEFTALTLYDKDTDQLVVHAAASKSSDGRRQVGRRIPVRGSAAGEAFTARRTLLFGEDDLTGRFAETAAPMREAGIRSVCAVPLVVGDRGLGTLTVGNLQPDAFTPESVAMIEAVSGQVAMAVANALDQGCVGRLARTRRFPTRGGRDRDRWHSGHPVVLRQDRVTGR